MNKNIKITVLILTIIILIAASYMFIGNTYGALNYGSFNEIDMSSPVDKIAIYQNGELTTNIGQGDFSNEKKGFLSGILGKNEKIMIGKNYNESIYFKNTSNSIVPCALRVTFYCQLYDSSGNRIRDLDKDIINIDFNLDNNSGWIVDERGTTAERRVLYYEYLLDGDDNSQVPNTTTSFLNSIKVNEDVFEYGKFESNNNIITASNPYNDLYVYFEIAVDATIGTKSNLTSSWGFSDDKVSIDRDTGKITYDFSA